MKAPMALPESLKKIENEINFYEKIKMELLAKGYSGKFIAIKDEEIVGIYETYEEAAKDVTSKFGYIDMFIDEISECEKTEEIYAATCDYGKDGLRRDGPKLDIKFGIRFLKPEIQSRGIIDTGASTSCMSSKFFQVLKFPVDGFRKVNSATGEGIFPTIAISLSFPDTHLSEYKALKVVVLPCASDFLIGRDILSRWIFLYEGFKGEFSVEETKQ